MTIADSILDIQSGDSRTVIALQLQDNDAQETLDAITEKITDLFPRDDIDVMEHEARWASNAHVPQTNRVEGSTHYIHVGAKIDPTALRTALTQQPQPEPMF